MAFCKHGGFFINRIYHLSVRQSHTHRVAFFNAHSRNLRARASSSDTHSTHRLYPPRRRSSGIGSPHSWHLAAPILPRGTALEISFMRASVCSSRNSLALSIKCSSAIIYPPSVFVVSFVAPAILLSTPCFAWPR